MLVWLLFLLGQASAWCSSKSCSHFLYCPQGILPSSCPKSWVNGIAPGVDSDPVSTDFLLCQEMSCLCNYVPLDSTTCQPIGKSGVTVGMGVDMQFIANKQEMITMGVSSALAEKLAPLAGPDKGDPIQLAEAHPLVLETGEAEEISKAAVNIRVKSIATLYNSGTKGTKFLDLPKGIRTALHSYYYQNGGKYDRNPDYWDAAFSQDWAALITVLRSATSYKDRRIAEAQIVAAALRECPHKNVSDVVLVLDGSGSIDSSDFVKAQNFLVNLVHNFTIGEDKTRVSLVVFSSQVAVAFYLNTFNSTSEIIQAIEDANKPNGGTSTGAALQTVISQVLTSEKGRRTGTASCLTMVLTDGQSGDSDLLAAQAPLLKDICSVMAIGIGDGINELELELIASQVNFVYPIADFQILIDGIQSMKKSICLIPDYVAVGVPSLVQVPRESYHYFALRLNAASATVRCTPSEGDFLLYGSWVDSNPTEYSYEFMVKSAKSRVMRFPVPANASDESANYTQAFVSLVGQYEYNNGTVEMLDGLYCSNMKPYFEANGCPDEDGSEMELLGLTVLVIFLGTN